MKSTEAFKVIWGDKLYHQRAREAFPLLVRQALMGETIFYSDLAEEMGMPNERNLNYVLGCIGNTLLEIAKHRGQDIPPIQCLVVNKATQLPGEGFDSFISDTNFEKLDKKRKRIMVDIYLNNIYSYPCWYEILDQLGLDRPTFPSIIFPISVYYGGGEGEQHKQLKEFVANNPAIVGLPTSCSKGRTEFALLSGDSLDVMFSWRDELIAVEVKSSISNMSDINRGLYQCVKYQAVLEAMLGVQGKPKNVRTVLILESSFPKELISTKNMLGIEVLSDVMNKT